jgi:hypothetical protein
MARNNVGRKTDRKGRVRAVPRRQVPGRTRAAAHR